jgi:hypothetical protein
VHVTRLVGGNRAFIDQKLPHLARLRRPPDRRETSDALARAGKNGLRSGGATRPTAAR